MVQQYSTISINNTWLTLGYPIQNLYTSRIFRAITEYLHLQKNILLNANQLKHIPSISTLLSTEYSSIQGVLLYHAFSLWTQEEQELFFSWKESSTLPCIIVEYTLAERTAEWICTWLRHLHSIISLQCTYTQYKTIQAFMRTGAMYGLLHKKNILPQHIYREPFIQRTVLVL